MTRDRYITAAVRLQAAAVETEPAPPLRRGTQLDAVPLARRAREPRQDSPVRAPRQQNPVPKGITPDGKDLGSDSPYGPFCTCGHERPEHRHGRCWIGWDGNPVHRTRSAIACPCTGWEPTP